MLAKIENNHIVKYPYSFMDLRRDFPNISFPTSMESDVEGLKQFNVEKVHISQPPIYDDNTSRLEESDPVFSDNKWIQSWTVVALSQEEIEEKIQNFKENFKQTIHNELENLAREKNYSSFESLVSYAGSNVESWQQEAIFAINLRDQVWLAVYDAFAQIEAGTLEASEESVRPLLPEIAW